MDNTNKMTLRRSIEIMIRMLRVDKKGNERHIFWGLDWLIQQAKTQMELRSAQAEGYRN